MKNNFYSYLVFIALVMAFMNCKGKKAYCIESSIMSSESGKPINPNALKLGDCHKAIASSLDLNAEQHQEILQNFSIAESKDLLQFTTCCDDSLMGIAYQRSLLDLICNNDRAAAEKVIQDSLTLISEQVKQTNRELGKLDSLLYEQSGNKTQWEKTKLLHTQTYDKYFALLDQMSHLTMRKASIVCRYKTVVSPRVAP